ncbi:MarR family transcriptional regulator [Microbacterium excoecariae]|uniref:MarR family transcriptional regulator n=1 Tax=Microbacterium excoecariae TaxID=2715210 RepID=UPI00140CFF09|nr:MarR family transcriptional regulator [Microbacterium excoecariae]
MSDDHDEAVRELESEFSDLLAHFRRVVTETAQRVSPGLNPGAYKLLTFVERHGPIRATEIVERVEIDKAHVSRMVRELDELGLIARAPSPEDGRVQLLSATDEARARLDAARAGRAGHLRDTVDMWTSDELRQLARLLHALSNNEAPPRE